MRIIKKHIPIVFLFFILFNCQSQTWPWAKSGIGNGEGLSICTDLRGNTIAAGYYWGQSIVFGTYTLTNSGITNAFLVKYDSHGNVLWAKTSNGLGSIFGKMSVKTDSVGNVFFAGSYDSTSISFDSKILMNEGKRDGFLVKIDSTGNVLWLKNIGGPVNDYITSVSPDNKGNTWVCGYFYSNPLTAGTFTLSNSGEADVFIGKYDSNGNEIWFKSAGNIYTDLGSNVSCDALGNVFLQGGFSAPSITFDSFTLFNSGSTLLGYLVKYDNNGNALWAKKWANLVSAAAACNDMSTDFFGNIYLAGSYGGSIQIGATSLSAIYSYQAFIAKLDPNGTAIWAKNIGSNDQLYSISVNASDLIVTGSIGNTYSATTIGTFTLFPPSGSYDPMYLAEYDSDGNVIYATILASGGDDANAVALDRNCNAYVVGDFYNVNPFTIGPNTLILTGTESVFVAKLSFNCQFQGINPLEKDVESYSSIYPNPNNGAFKFKIKNEIKNGELVLINSLGQKVYEQKISKGDNDIISYGLAKGLYNYLISEDGIQMGNGKIAIE